MAPLIEWEWPEINEGCHFLNEIRGRSCAGRSLLAFYAEEYNNAATIQTWIERIKGGQVSIDGSVITDTEHVLRPGAKMDYFRRPWREPAAPCKLEILFEDEHLLVVHKPSGLQVLPGGAFHQRCVLTLLLRYQQAAPDSGLASPAHRLGRGTSGVLVCAKHLAAKRALAQAFERATDAPDAEAGATVGMRKVYRCLVTGCPSEDQGLIETAIGHMRFRGLMSGLYAASADGKPSKSRWQVLQRRSNCSLLEVEIFTGRPHQIRIHMAAMGHPLVGDNLYGIGGQPQQAVADGADDAGNVMPGEMGYYLHSLSLQLRHPITNERQTFWAPPPPELEI